MKSCPKCQVVLTEGATSCPICHLPVGDEKAPARPKERPKWYFKKSSLIIGFLVAGPLILPAVWFNPAYSRNQKIVISFIVIFLTYLLFLALQGSVKSIYDYYELLEGVTKG